MGSADANLKIDQPDRLLFAHSPMRAFVFAVIASGFAWVCWRYSGDDGAFRYAVTGFAMLFVLVGVLGAFWRLELDINLATRAVHRRRGFWPVARSSQRPLDEADGIVLRLEYRSSGSKNNKRKIPWWFVSIDFPEDKKGTRIFATNKEVEGYEKWEYFAKRLKLDAINATEAGAAERKSWDGLDENLAARAVVHEERPRRIPNPPQDSGLEVIFNQGRKEILIAATGFSGGLVFLFFFGGIFVALGTGALLAGLGVIDVAVSGSKTAIALVPPIFIIVGLGIIWLGIRGSYSAKVIAVNSGNLVTETLVFGKRSGRQTVPLDKVESVAISGDVRSKRRNSSRIRIGGVSLGKKSYRDRENEIVVRADSRILRFGRSLDDAARTWLESACRYAVIHGQLP